MKDPRKIPHTDNVSYELPQYAVGNDGIEDAGSIFITFCKGNKNDPDQFRAIGVFVESVIQLAIDHLTSVNVGELKNNYTEIAIGSLNNAQDCLHYRKQDRIKRGVHQTYKE